MRRSLQILVAVLFAFSTTVAAAPPQQVTLLHVNDTHSHLAAWGPKDANLDGTLGGLSKAATIIAAEKTADPHALFVHGGDFVNGDLFFNEYLGVPELLLLQSLGLDVLVPGNHEFQFGPDFLAGVLNSAWPGGFGGVAVVGTNLDLSGFPILGAWISPTVVRDTGGVKVGFLGLTTPFDPLQMPYPVNVRENLAEIAQAAAADLRAQGAQVVVCIAHLGLDLSRSIAAGVPGIDVIVNAHDHVALPQPERVGQTLIVSAGEYYRWVGRMRLSVDGDHVSLVDYTLLSVDAATPPHPEVAALVGALQAGIVGRYGDVYHQVIGWAPQDIVQTSDPRHAKRDTALGNLFTDGYRAWTGTEIALEAEGFLDQALPKGSIVPADLFRSMSYGLPVANPGAGYISRPFQLATFRITGAALLGGLEMAITAPGTIFPQVSGMRFDFDASLPFGRRVLQDTVRVNGYKLDPARVYSVTANEGLVMFLPLLGISVSDVHVLPDFAVTAVRGLIESGFEIAPMPSGRIRDVGANPRSK